MSLNALNIFVKKYSNVKRQRWQRVCDMTLSAKRKWNKKQIFNVIYNECMKLDENIETSKWTQCFYFFIPIYKNDRV